MTTPGSSLLELKLGWVCSWVCSGQPLSPLRRKIFSLGPRELSSSISTYHQADRSSGLGRSWQGHAVCDPQWCSAAISRSLWCRVLQQGPSCYRSGQMSAACRDSLPTSNPARPGMSSWVWLPWPPDSRHASPVQKSLPPLSLSCSLSPVVP